MSRGRDLSPLHVELLTLLDSYGQSKAPPGALAARLGWKTQSASRHLQVLVARGLAERTTGPDQRRPMYRLTDAGRNRAAHEIAVVALGQGD